jgi:hypothetical protein
MGGNAAVMGGNGKPHSAGSPVTVTATDCHSHSRPAGRAEAPTGRGLRHATPPGAAEAVLKRKAPSTATRSAPGGR